MKFIVAAPHSFCYRNVPIRHCDRVARSAVREIEKCDLKQYIRHIHLSDKLRTTEHDYNRPNTNETAWRKDLRNRIVEIIPDFIFEIHSFPGNHELYLDRWPGVDLAIFASDHNAAFVEQIVSGIKSRVPSDYVVSIVKPWHPVSITDDVVKICETRSECKNICHSLFEFNEDMPSKRIPILAKAIYDTTLDLIEQNRLRECRGGNPSIFDAMISHPASIRGNTVGNTVGNTDFRLIGLGALFLILLMILLATGRAITMLTSEMSISDRLNRAWEYALKNPL
jgi:hypothetical protein